jgi:hypothetical protein
MLKVKVEKDGIVLTLEGTVEEIERILAPVLAPVQLVPYQVPYVAPYNPIPFIEPYPFYVDTTTPWYGKVTFDKVVIGDSNKL